MASWRILIGDRYGATISNVTPIAIGRQYVGALNRPAQFTFRVPSNHQSVATTWIDGYPLVGEDRTCRAYRLETQPDGSTKWVPRFGGYLWQVTDDGSETDAWTTCVCFDPLQLLGRRMARSMGWYADDLISGNNVFKGQGIITLDPVEVANFAWAPFDAAGIGATWTSADIARGLLNVTNVSDGFSGLLDFYPSTTYGDLGLTLAQRKAVGFNPAPASAAFTPQYDHASVAQAIIDLTNSYNAFDLEVVPRGFEAGPWTAYGVGQAAEYNGGQQLQAAFVTANQHVFYPLGSLRYWAPQRGTSRPEVVFAWGRAPRNVSRVSKAIDREQLFNYAIAEGATANASALDTASLSRFGPSIETVSATDVTDAAQLAAMASEAMLLGSKGAPTYTVTPTAGKCPLPFDNFDLGDSVTLAAGTALRGGFSALARVQGYTLDIPDDSNSQEVLSSLTATVVV